jgi:hypothetical protein
MPIPAEKGRGNMDAILAMIFGGGATGLLGTIFSRVFDAYNKAAERKFFLQKYKLDAEIRSKEMESEERIAEVKGHSEMLTASYAHDTGIGIASLWVINILRLVRPTITMALWVMVAIIWFSLIDIIYNNKELPWLGESAMSLILQIIGTVLYCATAATLWWFGTRDMRKSQ